MASNINCYRGMILIFPEFKIFLTSIASRPVFLLLRSWLAPTFHRAINDVRHQPCFITSNAIPPNKQRKRVMLVINALYAFRMWYATLQNNIDQHLPLHANYRSGNVTAKVKRNSICCEKTIWKRKKLEKKKTNRQQLMQEYIVCKLRILIME